MSTNFAQKDADVIRAIAQQLEQSIGTAHLHPWDKIKTPWQDQITQAIAPNSEVACLAFPQTDAELAAIVTCAHQNHCGIISAGSGSKLH